MTVRTYRYYMDPGHGWLAVKRDELKELGLLEKITPYSYQHGGTVYLEEDRDMSLMYEAKGWKGNEPCVKVVHTKENSLSFIRNYDPFTLEGPAAKPAPTYEEWIKNGSPKESRSS